MPARSSRSKVQRWAMTLQDAGDSCFHPRRLSPVMEEERRR